jgi:NhaA family Na+:H+ antiporter
VPLFALANAGVPLGGAKPLDLLISPVSLGIIAGLMLSKQLGITLAAFLTVKLGLKPQA